MSGTLKLNDTTFATENAGSISATVDNLDVVTSTTLPRLASDPANPVAGQMYYNTTDSRVKYHNGTEWISLEDLGPKLVEFKIWGAGGGSGSQERTTNAYHTTSYYAVKTGGAGGFVTCAFDIIPGTNLTLSVGGPGRGGLQQGNPSSASGGFNGGGNSTYSSNDAGGGGGGYSGVFVGPVKNQASAIAIAPGGGGGAGGPGYPSNTNDQANGGGGIASAEGTGNAGARNYGFFNANAGGGTPTSGGVGGDASVSDGDGNIGAVLTGANANYYGNSWGSGGGGGGGWYGGGSGANDGNSWSGGGGGAGSAFVRGSGITYNSDGILSLEGVIYRTHAYAIETYGSDDSTYNGMRVPAPLATSDPQYPGGNVGYGGDFNTSPPSGLDGYGGAIAYRIGGSGNWTVLTQIGDILITV